MSETPPSNGSQPFTDADLDRLIRCPKRFTSPPSPQLRLERGHYRNDGKLESEDGQHSFAFFVRQNKVFQENYSIGLEYEPGDGRARFILIRYNGPHGAYGGDSGPNSHHNVAHVHRTTQETLSNGRRPDSHIEPTNAFVSYEEALGQFVRHSGIMDSDQHFPRYVQRQLFTLDDDE